MTFSPTTTISTSTARLGEGVLDYDNEGRNTPVLSPGRRAIWIGQGLPYLSSPPINPGPISAWDSLGIAPPGRQFKPTTSLFTLRPE